MNQDLFLEIMNAAMHDNLLEFNHDKDELVKEFSKHSLTSYLYKAFKDNSFKNYYYASVMFNTNNDFEVAKIIDELNKHEIRHIFFKGFYLKDFYKDQALRVMGDVDFIFDKEHEEKVLEICRNLGFNETFDVVEKHYNFKKGKVSKLDLSYTHGRDDYVGKMEQFKT